MFKMAIGFFQTAPEVLATQGNVRVLGIAKTVR
jgi:hypothetical protein